MSPADTTYLDHVRGERRERAEALCAVEHPEEYLAVGGLPCVYCSRATAALHDTLDWETLAPPQREHDCNCHHCDLHGLEPVEHLTLVRVKGPEHDYVSERCYLVIRNDRAPIKPSYDGAVLGVVPSLDGSLAWSSWPIADEPPDESARFPRIVHRATILTGWTLRRTTPPDAYAGSMRDRIHGIVTGAGEHIGWALTLPDGAEDDT
jgi:hypothetical protein